MQKLCLSFLLTIYLGFGLQLSWAQGAASLTKVDNPAGAMISPSKHYGMGIRAASHAAFGKINAAPLNYAQIALIGIAIITNNNDNDGQPATFTGGSGSNMAGGG